MGRDHFSKLTRPGAVNRILVRATNWLGDAVLTTPSLMALRAGFPRAHIALLAKPGVAELFQRHPAVDEVIVYRDPGVHAGLGGKWALARALRRRRFDLAVLLQNAFEAALIAALTGIPNRYGYPTDGRWFLLTHRVPQPPGLRQKHEVEYYLELLRPMGLSITPSSPILYTTEEEDCAAIAKLLELGVASGQPLIGVNPGSTYGTAKRWLPDRYARVADWLASEYGAHVLIFGARGEEALGATIGEMMTAPHSVLSGRTTVRQLMALIKQCRLFVTNDAGPMHIAQALGIRVVAIFGPTDPRTTSPYGNTHELVRQPVDCSPCLLRECPIDHRCMGRILPDMVYAAAGKQLEAAGVMPIPGITEDRGWPSKGADSNCTGVVYLDRDGTLNWDPGYLSDPKGLQLLPGVGAAVARLNRAGFKTVLVTNQSGIGRGLITMQALEAIHERLCQLLAESGARLDAIYFCPHRPEEGCACRKPAVGLIMRAREEMGLAAGPSFVVGDRVMDVQLARNIGAQAVFVLSGYLPEEERTRLKSLGLVPDQTARDLEAAVDWILQSSPAALPRRPISSEIGR
jgi:heptosyltransferase-2